MGSYVLVLSEINAKSNASVRTIRLKLTKKEGNALFRDFHEPVITESVCCESTYNAAVYDESNNENIKIEEAYVNFDRIGVKKLPYRIFNNCFRIAKMEVIIGGERYVSPNFHTKIKRESLDENVGRMIDFIFDNCETYLYEKQDHSKIQSGIKSGNTVSLNVKLKLIKDIKDTYTKLFYYFKNSSQSKLINVQTIDDFSKLSHINADTIVYISTHPDELRPVSL